MTNTEKLVAFKHTAKVSAIVIATLALCFGFVYVGASVYASVAFDEPLTELYTESRLTNMVYSEGRYFVGTREGQTISLLRTMRPLYDKEHEVIAIEGGTINTQVGRFAMSRQIALPQSAFVGSMWCSSASLTWYPPYSLLEHSKKLREVCFEVTRD